MVEVRASDSPIDIFKSVLQTKYADFNGRARRAEYWKYALVTFGIGIGLVILSAILGAIAKPLGTLALVAYGIFALATLIPGLALFIRRLHDTGKSGWWLLIGFVPFGGIVLLVFTCLDSTQGSNKYGTSPKYGGA
jgi:uncharacterized membrane protein YhaH (DUF805 family)